MSHDTKNLYKDRGWIETAHEGKFDPQSPIFNIKDIAHSLSQLCRFNGHTRVFYSVAEHSLLVSKIMETFCLGDPLEGLLHDATEAYMSDVPAPLKQFLPDWQKLDDSLDLAMRQQFGLSTEDHRYKSADWVALFIEADFLLRSKGEDFVDPGKYRESAQIIMRTRPGFIVHYYEPYEAEKLFLERYNELITRDRTSPKAVLQQPVGYSKDCSDCGSTLGSGTVCTIKGCRKSREQYSIHSGAGNDLSFGRALFWNGSSNQFRESGRVGSADSVGESADSKDVGGESADRPIHGSGLPKIRNYMEWAESRRRGNVSQRDQSPSRKSVGLQLASWLRPNPKA